MPVPSRRPRHRPPPGRTLWYLALALGLVPLAGLVVIPNLWRGWRRSRQRRWALAALVALLLDQLAWLTAAIDVLPAPMLPLALLVITGLAMVTIRATELSA